MEQFQPDSEAPNMVELGRFLLRFCRVERITYHDDGERFETDADHTVMLATIACAFAAKYRPDLDLGLVAQYAIVHDMVEAYAGDTPTFDITPDELAAKQQREHDAYARIHNEFSSTYPWLPETIAEYESLTSTEAQFIKTLDKCMPDVTHILNNGATTRDFQIDFDQHADAIHEASDEIANSYGADHPELTAVKRSLAELIRALSSP